MSAEQRLEIERLQAIGYVSGSREAGGSGITVHAQGQTHDGLNLFASGHGPEAILMDMKGHVLHTWRRSRVETWPKSKKPGWWRRVFLFPNGDLLTIAEGKGIVKLDRDSEVLWARWNGAHHDLEVTADGDIYVLTRKAQIIPKLDPERPVLEDFIVLMDAEGEEKKKISLVEAFWDTEFDWVFSDIEADMEKRGDIMHTNSVELLDDRVEGFHPAFRKGHLLISLRRQNAIAIVDPDLGKATWVSTGPFQRQHDPGILDNLNVLVFDNKSGNQRSRVLELELPSLEIAWKYEGTEESPFWTQHLGTAQRPPNGNTLITDSENGRVFEVTREGEIVWEYRSPYRAGENGEYVATVPEMLRLPADFPTDWLAF